MPRRPTRPLAAALALALLMATVSGLVVPAEAGARVAVAGIGVPNPLDALPDPTDLVAKIFEFVFERFFGIGADVTGAVVAWLLAVPAYTDTGSFGELNALRSEVAVAAWALFVLVFVVAAVRYYASGFTSAGSYEAVEALTRAALAAGALALYPQLFGSLSLATNYLTYGITHAPAVRSGLATLLAAATVQSFGSLGMGTLAGVAGAVLVILLVISKVVIATLLALLYVAGSLVMALWPLPETAWLARTWLQTLIGLLLWPVVWALCFAIFAVTGASAFSLSGAFGDQVIKPWVAVAALWVAFRAPQLLARQAMLAGLMPSLGQTAARTLAYGRAASHASGAAESASSGLCAGGAGSVGAG